MTKGEKLFSIPEELLQTILRRPDWYLTLEEYLRAVMWSSPPPDKATVVKAMRKPFYEMVRKMLEADEIPLGTDPINFDALRGQMMLERGEHAIDTIVIHHSEGIPEEGLGKEISKLNTIGFVRLYAIEFVEKPSLRGLPISSGHFFHGKQVFFGYHGLIMPDGASQLLLADTSTAWHAGKIDVNETSIGIVLSGTYDETPPSMTQIEATAAFIREHYGWIPFDENHIIGHKEVIGGRGCPGKLWNEWKPILLEKLRQ